MLRSRRNLIVLVVPALVLTATYRLALGGWVPPLDARTEYPARCEVHGVPCLDDTVEISYGLQLLGYGDAAEEYARSRAEFPNANPYRMGGCVSGNGSPTRARIRYCPACREAAAAAPPETF